MNSRYRFFKAIALITFAANSPASFAQSENSEIEELTKLLTKEGFTGKIESTLPAKLGRSINQEKIDLGKSIFFDKHLGLHQDNSCAGCHSPTAAYGDTQPIAIGVQSNDIVGSKRTGPRNQRRTPSIINTAFYPALMWNGRFSSNSEDPFDNRKGFTFPLPEGGNLFPASDKRYTHLLAVQGHIPFTEQPEMAGFNSLGNTPFVMPRFMPLSSTIKLDTAKLYSKRFLSPSENQTHETPDFSQFEDQIGKPVPHGFPSVVSLNAPIRHAVLTEINSISDYREKFGKIYPSVKDGNGIEFWMIGEVLAEFQIAQTFANAPIDKFAQGDTKALNDASRRGAILFFGDAKCVECHAVSGKSNEMFSDFKMHVAGIPQISPKFGKGTGNVPFRNANKELSNKGNQDLGLWDFTEKEEDMYKFRTSPLRNIGLQPAFFHNGAFSRLTDAIKYHSNTVAMSKTYNAAQAGVPKDLQGNIGPIDPVIQRLAPQLKQPYKLSESQISDIADFLSVGLLDERAKPQNLMKDIPASVPSGAPLQQFQYP